MKKVIVFGFFLSHKSDFFSSQIISLHLTNQTFFRIARYKLASVIKSELCDIKLQF